MVLSTCSCTCWPFYVFFKKSVYSSLLPVFLTKLTLCYLTVSIPWISWMLYFLISYVVCRYFLPSHKRPLHLLLLLVCLFCCTEAFQFNITTPCMFLLFLFVLPVLSYHTLWFLLGFLLFQVLNLNLNSFQVNFLSGVSQWPSFILLHIGFQFSQHQLLKRLCTTHWVFSAPLSNINHFFMGLFLGS